MYSQVNLNSIAFSHLPSKLYVLFITYLHRNFLVKIREVNYFIQFGYIQYHYGSCHLKKKEGGRNFSKISGKTEVQGHHQKKTHSPKRIYYPEKSIFQVPNNNYFLEYQNCFSSQCINSARTIGKQQKIKYTHTYILSQGAQETVTEGKKKWCPPNWPE